MYVALPRIPPAPLIAPRLSHILFRCIFPLSGNFSFFNFSAKIPGFCRSDRLRTGPLSWVLRRCNRAFFLRPG